MKVKFARVYSLEDSTVGVFLEGLWSGAGRNWRNWSCTDDIWLYSGDARLYSGDAGLYLGDVGVYP